MSAGHGQPEMRNRTSKVQLRAQHHPVNVLTEERAFIAISLENVLRSGAMLVLPREYISLHGNWSQHGITQITTMVPTSGPRKND